MWDRLDDFCLGPGIEKPKSATLLTRRSTKRKRGTAGALPAMAPSSRKKAWKSMPLGWYCSVALKASATTAWMGTGPRQRVQGDPHDGPFVRSELTHRRRSERTRAGGAGKVPLSGSGYTQRSGRTTSATERPSQAEEYWHSLGLGQAGSHSLSGDMYGGLASFGCARADRFLHRALDHEKDHI